MQVGDRFSNFEVKAWGTSGFSAEPPHSSSLCLRLCHRSLELRFLGSNCMLMTLSPFLQEYVERLQIWQNAIEEKSLRVNAGKAKIMICEGLYL